MKKVKDGLRVLRGSIPPNSYDNRLQLFDGKATTGFRVVEFRVISSTPTDVDEINAVLRTESASGVPYNFDMGDNQTVAFSIWGAPNQVYFSSWDLVVEGNMVVEDLWISNYQTGTDPLVPMAYYILLQKYTFAAWDGAAFLAMNSQ